MGIPSKADQETLALARKRFEMCNAALSDSRKDELDDLRFMAASPDNQWQWPQDVLDTRGAVNGQTVNARPCITINKLPQHVKQVTNEQRQNRPAGKVIPVDDEADIDVADVLNGVIRHIEYISDADVAYDTACDNQVTMGEGYYRLLTDFVDENSFDQEIKIGRIRNSFSVYMDPLIQDPSGSDAKWCMITHDILRDEFETEYPNATPITSIFMSGTGNAGISSWITEKSVRIAEYYYIEEKEFELVAVKLPNGEMKTSTKAEYNKAFPNGGPPIAQTRKSTRRVVKYCKHNGYEILEANDWPGKWIPVIRVIGNEFEIEGVLYLSGLIRNAKDAQRMYNYWTSQEAEMLALAPKAPFIGYSGQFEGYEQKWKTANINNWPYLEINAEAQDHEGKPLPLPQRSQPPMQSSGLLAAKMGAADDIKGTTGQYDSSLGNESSEKSGRAILAREKQGDTGTYHYVDNLAKAIRFGTRQMIDLIPKIYNTARVARIIGIDGEIKHVKVDPNLEAPKVEVKDPETGAIVEKIYNFGIGTYDVMATAGQSYMTQRQETAQNMIDLSQGASDPTMSLVMRYFAIKNMDFPEAKEFAGVLKRMAPPGLLDADEDTPEVAKLKQTVEQMQQGMQQQQQVMQEMAKSLDVAKAENDEFATDIKAYEAQTKRLELVAATYGPATIQDTIRKTIMEVMQTPPLVDEAAQLPESQPFSSPEQMMPPPGAMPMQAPPPGAM